jgi:CheY-like chemotaxis protein
MTLKKRGYVVDVAESGRQTVEKWMGGRYDLILMDLEMPDMDGFQATTAIRKIEQERGGHTPIFAVSAHPKNSHMNKCLSMGMDDYITKPVNADELDLKIGDYRNKTSTASNGPTSKEPLFDLSPMRAMFTEDEMRELTSLYLKRAGELIEDMDSALAIEEIQSLRLKAHQLKGASSQFKIHSISTPAAKIEEMAEKGDLAGVYALIDSVKRAFETVSSSLDKEIKG